MKPWMKFLIEASYRKSALWVVCLSVLIAGAVLAQILSGQSADVAADGMIPDSQEEALVASMLTIPQWIRSHGLHTLPALEGAVDDPVYSVLADGLSGDAAVARRTLENLKVPERFIALGVLAYAEGRVREAAEAYASAWRVFPSETLAWERLQCLEQLGESGEIVRLKQEPEFNTTDLQGFWYSYHLDRGELGLMVRHHYALTWGRWIGSTWILAGATLAVWTWVLLGFQRKDQSSTIFRFGCLSLALLLGVISTGPVMWVTPWWDRMLGIRETGELIGNLVYFCVSVGLREEAWKLLAVAPVLLCGGRDRSDLDALLIGCAGGLGFAVQENGMYFDALSAGAVVGRFLSANLLHIMATGLLGLWFSRAVRSPSRYGVDFGWAFLTVTGIHGLYDTLLTVSLPGLEEDTSYFAGTVLALLALMFFRELRVWMFSDSNRISLTARYLLGVCLLVAMELVAVSSWTTFGLAWRVIAQSALASAVFLFVFTTQISEALR